MKRALPRHRCLLRARRPFLIPVSKCCLQDGRGLGACVEEAAE